MKNEPQVYLVTYDISDQRRWRRIYRIMRGFGDHLQLSVFRCVLSESQRARFLDAVERTIKPTEDQVIVVPLGAAASGTAWRAFALGRPLIRPQRSARVV